MSQEVTWWQSFNPCPTSWKLADHARLLLRFHDAVPVGRGLHALQPLALAVASARVFPCLCTKTRMRHNRLCLVFSKKFNTKSALSVHQTSTLPQKIDSRGGLLWCKKGLVVHAGKMNFYLNWPPPTLVLGPFAAKCNAFWCKTQCNMPLNAMRFGTKCSAFWCKTQGKMMLIAVLNAAKCEAKSINIRLNGINKTF